MAILVHPHERGEHADQLLDLTQTLGFGVDGELDTLFFLRHNLSMILIYFAIAFACALLVVFSFLTGNTIGIAISGMAFLLYLSKAFTYSSQD
jgi:hypothetical protein